MNNEPSDLNLKIGEAAGVVYNEPRKTSLRSDLLELYAYKAYTLKNGECNLTQLKNHLVGNGFDAQTYIMSIGWLAREDKLDISKVGKKWSIRLK
ncbi:MAG: hypothetical protein GQ533_04735 [Methanosarcinaceae archaeon]|nr:hypothetical protein [Methanosarcinaceae archaeon]